MQIRDVDALKTWLLKKLEPLCDADPAALAKYVVALLRKDKPKSDLKELCVDQLEVFLAKETTKFVDHLFRSLDSESYLRGDDSSMPASPKKPKVGGLDTPVEMHGELSPRSAVRKLSEDVRHREVDEDDRDFRRSRRGVGGAPDARRGGDPADNRIFRRRMDDVPGDITRRLGPRQQRQRPYEDVHSTWHRYGRNRSSSSNGDSGSDNEDKTKKRPRITTTGDNTAVVRKGQRCKDYDEKGFCILGENCPFDHGKDPLVINPSFPPPPLPLGLPSMPLHVTKPGLLVPPVVPVPLSGRMSPSSNTEGYNPEDPGLNAVGSAAPQFLGPPPALPPLPLRPPYPPLPAGANIPPPPLMGHLGLSNVSNMSLPNSFYRNRHVNRSAPKTTDTLVIRKIPRALNTVTKLSSHFEKFGTIVNMTVKYDGDPEGALIQFSSPAEAKKACECPEAVLNNRFIRVYYHNRYERLGSVPPVAGSQTSLEIQQQHRVSAGPAVKHDTAVVEIAVQSRPIASEELSSVPIAPVAKLPDSQSNHLAHPLTPTKTVASTLNHVPTSTHTSLGASGAHQIKQAQQKGGVAKKNMEVHKKAQALLQKQLEQQKLLLAKLERAEKAGAVDEASKIKAALKALSSAVSKTQQTATKAAVSEVHERHPSNGDGSTESLKETAEDLRRKMEAKALSQEVHTNASTLLTPKNEAQKLGLIPNSAAGGGGGGKDDLRSKISNKPRQLLVLNVTDRDNLTGYLESFGGLTGVEVDPTNSNNLIFTFRTRTDAEKIARSSPMLNGKPLIMKWFVPKPPVTPTVAVSEASSTSSAEVKPIKVIMPAAVTEEDDMLLTSPTSATPTTLKPLTAALHLLDDDEEEEDDEGQSWKR